MGGYARYVWPCFGFACAVLAWNLWSARRFLAAAAAQAARAPRTGHGGASNSA